LLGWIFPLLGWIFPLLGWIFRALRRRIGRFSGFPVDPIFV